jgi:hypothetical protein
VDKVGQILESMLLWVIPQTRAMGADSTIGLDTSSFEHGQCGALEHVVTDSGDVERCQHSLLGSVGGG